MANILIAEDDQSISNAYALKLGQLGHELKIADNGQEALEICQTFQPHIILLDMLMPGMSGLEFLERYRADGGQAKVVVFSNTEAPDVMDRARELGIERYLQKLDFTPQQIAEYVDNLLKS